VVFFIDLLIIGVTDPLLTLDKVSWRSGCAETPGFAIGGKSALGGPESGEIPAYCHHFLRFFARIHHLCWLNYQRFPI
jgi:hypothetical protein